MNVAEAHALITQTFTKPFDRGRFGTFVVNVLNHIDESKAGAWNSQYIKDAFKEHVNHYERLGTYTSPEDEKLDVLIVHLTKEFKLERARTAIRNFVADHLRTRDEKDAALVAFVSPSEKQWRFSYVKMDYASVLKESGKVGVETRLTPARRFSYLVGEGESCHTAQTRFVSLLEDGGTSPALKDIEEAFSVEAVTKDFFTKYAELFNEIHEALEKLIQKDANIRAEFETKSVNTIDFAKKLLGQIVFLYFLQKKGWLGVPKGQDWGDGPHDFLRRLEMGAYGKYANFFNDVLEPLFYDTLATDRGNEAWCNRFNCRIPFLNGGLFEPLGVYNWRKLDILLPNKLFRNSDFVEEGITGTGVLDVFDRYNFTVSEAQPLEKDVAIDPEMLGKVFENLIEENRRRGLGAFYTPREIVHFMCQESLITYLDSTLNREKTLVDRADLETLVHFGEQISHYEAVETNYPIKMPKNVQQNARLIDEMLADITVCDPAVGSGAFPVGIMHEIVSARKALTLYFNDVHERTAYRFKHDAIQYSLYGVDIDQGAVEIAKLRLWLSLVVDEENVKQIKPLPNLDYKIVTGNSLFAVEKTLFNQDLFRRLEKLKPQYFDESDRNKKNLYKSQIDSIIHELTRGKETFDFGIFFSEVFHRKAGFDVLIMNPPYGADFSDEEKNILKKKYDHISERIRNSFLYFMGLAYDLLANNGMGCVIVPNEFLFQIYMTKARKFFLTQAHILFAVNVGESAFEAIVPTCVVGLKKEVESAYKIPVADLRHCTLPELPAALNTHSFPVSSSAIVLNTPNSMFSFDLDRSILISRLSNECCRFGEFCDDVANGISTSCDEVYIVSNSLAEKEHLESQYLKLCIRGGQFNRFYCPETTKEFVLYITNEFVQSQSKNIAAYLSKYKTLLVAKSVEKNQGTRDWHVLFRARYTELFAIPKILIRQTGDRIVAAVDDAVGYYCIDSVNVAQLKPVHNKRMSFFLGLLNSSLVNFFYREISQEKGRVLAQVKPQRIKNLPIKDGDKAAEQAITTLVDKVVSIKKRNQSANTTALEQQIDDCVYKLYKLTGEEIKLVESSLGAQYVRVSG